VTQVNCVPLSPLLEAEIEELRHHPLDPLAPLPPLDFPPLAPLLDLVPPDLPLLLELELTEEEDTAGAQ